MKKIFIKKVLSASIVSFISLQTLYVAIVETSTAVAASASDVVVVTLNVDAGISITDGANATMTPNIGLTSNKSVGSSSWNVKTSSVTGYTLAVKAFTSPALKNGSIDSFNDYTPVGGVPDLWGGVASGTKEFGFSAYGTHALADFGSPVNCGNTSSGVPDASAKYQGFSTSDYTIATSSTVTTTAGVVTNICFAAEQNGTYAASGVYTATITATASTI